MENRKVELLTGEQKKKKFGSDVFGAAQGRVMALGAGGGEDGDGVEE